MIKRFNIYNKILTIILLVLVVLNIYRFFTFKSWDRYYFASSVTAPQYFPIHVVNVNFDFPNDELGGYFHKSIEEINAYYPKWGEAYYFPETYQTLPLPEFLNIEYYDYRSNLYYKSQLKLPKEIMQNLFRKAKEHGHLTEIYKPGQNVKGLIFLLGIANNGNIMLWLKGENLAEIVLTAKLKPQPLSKSEDRKHYKTNQEYINNMFQDMPDSLKVDIHNGIENHANYIDSTKQFIQSKL